jgi:hypothetical protein
LVLDALEQALYHRRTFLHGLVHHSDRGSVCLDPNRGGSPRSGLFSPDQSHYHDGMLTGNRMSM